MRQSEPFSVKSRTLARLAQVAEAHLIGASQSPETLSSAWDAWWIAFRLALPSSDTATDPALSAQPCSDCRSEAAALAATDPPGDPDQDRPERACGCRLAWAVAMREDASRPFWPHLRLSLALLKPGAPRGRIHAVLRDHYRVLSNHEQTLNAADTRRMYPDAHGHDFIAAVDAYLTSGPSQVLVLLASGAAAPDPLAVKRLVRARLDTTALRNHLHMPDNPGETWADLSHFTDPTTLTGLYERHARHDRAHRMAYYRHVLGHHHPDPDRLRPRAA